MSDKALAQKLAIKEGFQVLLVGAPGWFPIPRRAAKD